MTNQEAEQTLLGILENTKEEREKLALVRAIRLINEDTARRGIAYEKSRKGRRRKC